MSYSRWGASVWYTYWCSRPGKSWENRNNATFSICGVCDFEAARMRKDIEGCLDEAMQKAGPERTASEREELRGYMKEFLADVNDKYPRRSKHQKKGSHDHR